MASVLVFDQTKLPRTMSREEWRGIDRWRRLTQKNLRDVARQEEQTLRRLCEDIGAFGTAGLVLCDRLAGDMINPPMLLGPYQDVIHHVDIRPGAVAYV